MRSLHVAASLALTLALAACSSSPASTGGAGHGGSGHGGSGHGGAAASGGAGGSAVVDAGTDAMEPVDAAPEGGDIDGGDAGPAPVDTLGSNRDRLLGAYLQWLKANAPSPQSNGVSGANVADVCALWDKLDPSSQAVFLTITARLQGSLLGADGSSMLWHVTRIYRIAGGQGATATDPGSCGGAEYNRMIMSMDDGLRAALLAASVHQGAVQGNGKYDIADIPSGGFWRDSHDLGGPHAPFDVSDETEDGAPRGQVHYFADPASAAANAPLGRVDLMSLVDPAALEMDQDYDCVHNSNPVCSYVAYGPFCFPMTSELGTQIFVDTYGDFDPGYRPSGCN